VRRSLLSVAVLVAAACGDRGAAPACEGDRLFGRPTARTGLTDEQCGPRCTCHGEPFAPREYGDADADALLAWQHLEPFAELTADPYLEPPPPEPPLAVVCGVLADGPGTRRYRLRDYPSAAEAVAAGATPSHQGRCGVCSTLADLAVYMRHPDLTEPVRACGLAGGGTEQHVGCLEALGFTRPCAQIWYYNTLHTRDHCLLECLAALDAPYHLPDGELNDCLRCDEEQSGPVFKAVAGRTRRNTGVPSAMCRPCREVTPLAHDYE
jgi:hypothetical protein